MNPRVEAPLPQGSTRSVAVPEAGPELRQARLPPLGGKALPAVLRARRATELDAVSTGVALVRRQVALIAADQGDHELTASRVERSNHGAIPGCETNPVHGVSRSPATPQHGDGPIAHADDDLAPGLAVESGQERSADQGVEPRAARVVRWPCGVRPRSAGRGPSLIQGSGPPQRPGLCEPSRQPSWWHPGNRGRNGRLPASPVRGALERDRAIRFSRAADISP